MLEPQDDDDVPPLDPVKVALFVLLLGGIAFAGWRLLRAQAAVAAVADASKDYRKLFAARAPAVAAPAPRTTIAVVDAPPSGMMLKIDDDMRTPKPVPAAPVEEKPAAAEAKIEAPVVAPAVLAAPAPVVPAAKTFVQPKLNKGGMAGLNGGAGIRPRSEATKK
jgi:hypothetical protein